MKSTALNRYGNSSRLTTKPARSGTSTASLSSAAHSAAARSRVAADACSGYASSTSFIFATGLKTCSPTNCSARPDACASSATDSDEVVVLMIASGPASAPRRASRSLFSAVSSAIASTRKLASASASKSVTIRTRPAS